MKSSEMVSFHFLEEKTKNYQFGRRLKNLMNAAALKKI